jgi:hypothetical protein
MGNEVAIGCRSCLILTMARFPTGGVRTTLEWVLCCASAWVAGSVKAIKATHFDRRGTALRFGVRHPQIRWQRVSGG